MRFSHLLLGFLLLAALFASFNARRSRKKKALKHKKLERRRAFKVDFKRNGFLKDGRPFHLISGDMHYFRTPQFYWMDRFIKMKHAGLNTVST